MEFFIRQGATEPALKLKMLDDGKNDKSSYNDLLENSIITFEMSDIKTKEPIILDGVCHLTNRITKVGHVTDEYYIVYEFTEEETSKTGKFEGKIIIQFLNNQQQPTTKKLILPLREKLYINII